MIFPFSSFSYTLSIVTPSGLFSTKLSLCLSSSMVIPSGTSQNANGSSSVNTDELIPVFFTVIVYFTRSSESAKVLSAVLVISKLREFLCTVTSPSTTCSPLITCATFLKVSSVESFFSLTGTLMVTLPPGCISAKVPAISPVTKS